MVGQVPGKNGESSAIDVTELVISHDGKDYRLSRESINKAFRKAGLGKLTGPQARYFIRMDGEMKNLTAVLNEIVPIPPDQLTPSIVRLVKDIFEALGFEILDRQAQHVI